MTTKYIDVNASNSKVIDNTNYNRYIYQLNEGMELPAGTQVSVQSSFINKKGITGQSIEIDEDVEEELCFNYYVVDTTYNSLIQQPQDPGKLVNFDFYVETSTHINYDKAYKETTDMRVIPENVGRSEQRMPLCNIARDAEVGADGNKDVIVPMVGKCKIRVPKGTYSVNSLAELISSQMNGSALPTNFSQTSIEYQKENSQFTGLLASGITSRLIQAEEPWVQNSGADAANLALATTGTAQRFWDAYKGLNDIVPAPSGGNDDAGNPIKFSNQFTRRAGNNPWNALGGITKVFSALSYQDAGIYSAVGITPDHYELVRRAYIDANNANLNAPMTDADVIMSECFHLAGTNRKYMIGFEAMRDNLSWNLDPDEYDTPPSGLIDRYTTPFSYKLADGFYCNSRLNYFDKGITVGTDNPVLLYNADKSGFAFDRFHQPRKFPTNDKYGNEFSDRAGQEGFYIKRFSTGNFLGQISILENIYDFTTYTGSPADNPNYDVINSVVQTFMTKTGGIEVFNWANLTALAEGNAERNNSYTSDLMTFREFFKTEADAQNAWQKTLWYKLGFSYQQLQNPNSWGKAKFYTSDAVPHTGFSTDAIIDASSQTTISTLFNSFSSTTDDKKPTSGAFPKPTINGGIQLYNNLDVNVPAHEFSNNGSSVQETVVVAPYQGSFYEAAVMIPVISETEQEIADNLPTLSTHGYFLISSDIVGDVDIANNADPLSLLDVVPLSSLSNQDFIADRTQIVHTLTNPKVINNISIAILKPDLTAPLLEPNSSVILKIEKPMPAPTEIIANTINQQEQQAIEQEVAQMEQEAQKANKKTKKK
tara:strand:- start:658 stop:3126 length:2469 start_codon:yes stop_codon:yes gene_type:complete